MAEQQEERIGVEYLPPGVMPTWKEMCCCCCIIS